MRFKNLCRTTLILLALLAGWAAAHHHPSQETPWYGYLPECVLNLRQALGPGW
jgi:hypothetical protein